MHYTFRNVNAAFLGLVRDLAEGTLPSRPQPSRYGDVLQVEQPVVVTYTRPTERVLLNSERDANPFFHLYEALWMLAGRRDVAPLAYYASRMREFSADGVSLHGAYGYRWRHAGRDAGLETHIDQERLDQLDFVVEHLRASPHSRRAVIQMWDAGLDLTVVGERTSVCPACAGARGFVEGGRWGSCCRCDGKGFVILPPAPDVPCNLAAAIQIRDEPPGAGPTPGQVLDLTVFNRSNDMIWGMLGANVVHFSVLQEYLAARLGVGVGHYHQFTANLHVYAANWKPTEWLAAPDAHHGLTPEWTPVPLVHHPEEFEEELPDFVVWHNGARAGAAGDYAAHVLSSVCRWSEPFLRGVAHPMLVAFHHHRAGRPGPAAEWAASVQDEAWAAAAAGWLARRAGRRRARAGGGVAN